MSGERWVLMHERHKRRGPRSWPEEGVLKFGLRFWYCRMLKRIAVFGWQASYHPRVGFEKGLGCCTIIASISDRSVFAFISLFVGIEELTPLSQGTDYEFM